MIQTLTDGGRGQIKRCTADGLVCRVCRQMAFSLTEMGFIRNVCYHRRYTIIAEGWRTEEETIWEDDEGEDEDQNIICSPWSRWKRRSY